MSETLLKITGQVGRPIELTFEDLAGFDDESQVRDVSRLAPHRRGDAVKLAALLDRVAPLPKATHLTLHAADDGFSASVPLDAVRDRGLLVYRVDGRPLSSDQGGPLRFLVPDAAACRTAEIDACANVKSVDRIELTAGRGRDTRR